MIEIFLNIASFSISFGGLFASVFVVKDEKKKAIVLGVIFAALIATSGITLYSSYQHQKDVGRAKKEVIKILLSEAITFDDLYQNIFPPVPHELLREALYDGIENGAIGYRPMHLQSEGKMMSVKVFYARR